VHRCLAYSCPFQAFLKPCLEMYIYASTTCTTGIRGAFEFRSDAERPDWYDAVLEIGQKIGKASRTRANIRHRQGVGFNL
jgi:hypothetical protein